MGERARMLKPTPIMYLVLKRNDLFIYLIEQNVSSTFCGFSMDSNQYWAGRVYDMCVYYITGAP